MILHVQGLSLLLSLAMMTAFAACSPEDRTFPEPTESTTPVLIGPLKSFTTPHMVQELTPGVRWNTVEQPESVSGGGSRRPVALFVLRTKKFEHLGFVGELKLEFLNERLMSAWFYPDDSFGYSNAVRRQLGASKEDSVVSVGEHVQVVFATDYENRKYAAWEDKRLRDYMKKLLRLYG